MASRAGRGASRVSREGPVAQAEGSQLRRQRTGRVVVVLSKTPNRIVVSLFSASVQEFDIAYYGM